MTLPRFHTKKPRKDGYETPRQGFRDRQQRSEREERRERRIIVDPLADILPNGPIIGKVKNSSPVDDLQAYLAYVKVVDKTRAQYMVVHDNGQPVMTFSGEFLYFNKKDEAFNAQRSLKNRFDIGTTVVYGPMHRMRGQNVPIPKEDVTG